MGRQKSRTSKVSNGGRQKANVAHEAKRQAKFAAKRENGTNYVYKPNPYKPGTVEWAREKAKRAEKAKSSKSSLARWTSIMDKLENELTKKCEQKKTRIQGKKKMAEAATLR